MNILCLMSDVGAFSGIAEYNRAFISALERSDRNRSVTLLSRIPAESTEWLTNKTEYRRHASRGKLAYIWESLKLLLTGKRHEVVVCGHVFLLPIACAFSTIWRSPLVLIIHGVEAWSPPRNPLTRSLVRRIDQLIFVSHFTLGKFLSWSRVRLAEDKMLLMPPCIDLERFEPAERNHELTERYGTAQRKVLVTLCRLDPQERYKGIDTVLETLPDLLADYPDLLYLVGGSGDDQERLVNKVKTLGISDHVVFAGRVPETEKLDFYRLADGFVMPGRGEGFGIVYLEALACGVPVMGSALDASKDTLMDGELGVVVNPDNRDEVIEGIKQLLSTPGGQRPEKLEHYSYPRFTERVLKFVDRLGS